MVIRNFFVLFATVALAGAVAPPVAASNERAAGVPSRYDVPTRYVIYERCVRERESNGRWDAVNPTGKYRGAYQFDHALASGATWHMLEDIIEYSKARTKKQARVIARKLRNTPMNKWPAWAQTSAFVQTLDGHDAEQPWSGKSHWAGGRWTC